MRLPKIKKNARDGLGRKAPNQVIFPVFFRNFGEISGRGGSGGLLPAFFEILADVFDGGSGVWGLGDGAADD